MNIELEILERAENMTIEDNVFHNEHKGKWLSVADFNILKQFLTSPTADEVCKALSEYYEEDIIYTKNKYKNGFHLKNSLYVIKFENNNIEFVNKEYFNHKYLPSLIEILGKFYRGKQNEYVENKFVEDVTHIGGE